MIIEILVVIQLIILVYFLNQLLDYIEWLASNRVIARRVRTDMAYIYLYGFDAPDFRTINRFYKNYPEFIGKTLLEFVKYAKETV